MNHGNSCHWGITAAIVGLLAVLLAWPGIGAAQVTVNGQATAVRATVFDLLGTGTTTVLADTGTLGGTTSDDARDAAQLLGSVGSLLSGEVLHSNTIGLPDQVASKSSLAALALSVAVTTVDADFVMAEAASLLNGGAVGTSYLDNLRGNGVPVSVNGNPNQVFYFPGGRVVMNEQIPSAGGMVVNALHVIVDGVADIVIGSATARIQ